MLITLDSQPAPGRDNQDLALTTPTCAVLLDGVGTPRGTDEVCRHGTVWYVRRLGAELLSRATFPPESPLSEALAAAITAVTARHSTTCDVDDPRSPAATVAVLRQHTDRYEYLVLGDAMLVLVGPADTVQAISDHRVSQFGAAERRRMDGHAIGSPEHTARLHELTDAQRRHRNRQGGYWVAASDPEAAAHAVTGSVPAEDFRAAALLSDGASRLADRFSVLDWPELLAVLEHHGPAELLRRTRTAEDTDPAGERWPRGKRHDDATIAYCRS